MTELSATVPFDRPGDSSTASSASGTRPRLDSVDLLRGAIMALMLLDHTRDFIMNGAINPTDLKTATPALFFTRWITHFCAPTFMLLAGVGAFLSRGRGKTTSQLSWFLFRRGLWLIVLELTLSRWGLTFNLHYDGFVWLLVLWSLGCAMIFLAALVHLPRWAIGTICFAMIVGHDAFDGVRASSLGHLGPLWILLHEPGAIPVFGGVLFDGYPLIPWIAVIGVGYLLGGVIADARHRRRTLLAIGAATTVAFVLLRLVNLYGDPHSWASQPTAVMTLCAFLNVTKQPPSLAFLTVTLGPALLALALFDRARLPNWTRPLVTYGRVPLFFYLLNFPVPHLLGIGLAAATGQDWRHFLSPIGPFAEAPTGFGHGLAMTYLAWLIGLLVLYPLCAWFAAVKQRHRSAWLSYL